MNHLIIYAHPNPKSFCNAIKETLYETSQHLGVTTEIRDLYALNFHPVHTGEDALSLLKGTITEDIKVEQDYIRWADVISLVHPNWWNGFPAILKGYIDRVVTWDFAYTYNETGLIGLLKGKKAIVFTTTGGSKVLMEQVGQYHTLTNMIQVGVLGFCGVEVLAHKIFHKMFETTEESREAMLKEVQHIALQNLDSTF